MLGSGLLKFLYLFTAMMILSPLAALCVEGMGASETLSFLMGAVIGDVLLNTIVITTITGFGVLVWGVSCAWLVTRYSFAWRRTLSWLLVMPLAFPAYILAYIYTDFFDAAGWGAQPWLVEVMPDLRNAGGASFILTFCLYPYVYIFARNGFLAISANQMENSHLLGANKKAQFFDIALPTARPFIIVGLMLVIMELLADYGTMDYFGLRVFSTVIYDSWAGYGDITAAAQFSLMLLVFVFGLVWAERQQRNRMRFYAMENGASACPRLQYGSFWMSVWCLIPVFIGFFFPALLLMKMNMQHVGADDVMRTFPYLVNTFEVCFVVAFVGVLLAFALGLYKRENNHKITRMLFTFCGFGYALPGIILGLGLLLVSSVFTAMNVLVTGTFLFLVMGYLIRFLNIPLQSLEAGYEKISPSIDQASRLMRHGAFDDLWQIKLPLLTPAMLSAGLILSVEVMKELPLTLVLRPFDFDTLAVYTYNLASDERLAEAAFPALCIVVVGCIPILFLQRFVSKKQR